MAKYNIILYKGKKDLENGEIYKIIEFEGRYIDALREGHKLSSENKCSDYNVPMPPSAEAYGEFIERFKKLTEKNKTIVTNTLSNIFTMRLIGNKTHGDLAEVGIAEFINQYMYDYWGEHVGKELFRSKTNEEDIVVSSEIDDIEIPISLKAYGDGPLQLSTDKDSMLWTALSALGEHIDDKEILEEFLSSKIIQDIFKINVMPLIYREKSMECNILIFDAKKALSDVDRIIRVEGGKGGRIHPVYKFLNLEGEYICEVRYGGKTANALQRGLWTHTKNANNYFQSATNGWIGYRYNREIVELIRLALNSPPKSHVKVNEILKNYIERIKIDAEI